MPSPRTRVSTPDAQAEGEGSESAMSRLPTELIEMILEKAAKPGKRRASYRSLMHVCKSFLSE